MRAAPELVALMLLLGGDSPKAGSPTVVGALVAAEVMEQTRGDKIIVFKKKRRKNYRRKKGHRQDLTLLEGTPANDRLSIKKTDSCGNGHRGNRVFPYGRLQAFLCRPNPRRFFAADLPRSKTLRHAMVRGYS